MGAATLVVALHLTGLVLPASVGVWIVLGLSAAVMVFSALRGRFRGILRRRSILDLVIALAIGAVGAGLALWPSLVLRSPLAVQATPSNDAFYYVAVSDWMESNPITHGPLIGVDPGSGLDSPAYGPAAESLRLGLRVGQELVHAAVSSVFGLDPVATFSPLLAVYVLLLAGSLWVLGTAFRLPTAAKAILAGAVVTTFTVLNQVQNQNADSLLGVALVPLVLGLVAAAMSRDDDVPRPPLWLAGVSLAALVGTYTEYLPFAGVVLVFLVLIGPWRSLGRRVLRGLAIVGLSLVVGFFAWFRAIQGLALAAQLSTQPGGPTAGLGAVRDAVVLPYDIMLAPRTAGPAEWVVILGLYAVAALALVGVLLSIAMPRSRGLGIGVAAAMAGAVVVGLRSTPYITGRAADMVTPLVLAAAVVGWASALGALRRRSARTARPARILAVVAGALAVAVIATSIAGDARYLLRTGADDRQVSNDFAQAADWIDAVEQDGGANVTVATAGMFDQLWITDALRQLPDVEYVSLRGDLGYRSDLSMTQFWGGDRDRYVLVGPGAYFSPDSAVIEQNTTFALLDLDRPATVAVPVVPEGGPQSWSYSADPGGPVASTGLGVAAVELLSSRSDLTSESLAVTGLPDGATVVLSQDGVARSASPVQDGSARLDLGAVALTGGTARVEIRVDDQTPTEAGIPFALVGVTERP